MPLPSAWRREALRTNLWLLPTVEIVLAVALFAGTHVLDRAAYDGSLTCRRGSSAARRTPPVRCSPRSRRR